MIQSFQAYATDREPISGMAIQARLFGAYHTVRSPSGRITIRLPNSTDSGQLRDYSSRVGSPNDPDTTWYSVDAVTVRLDFTSPVKFIGTDNDFNTSHAKFDASTTRAMSKLIESVNIGLTQWKRTLRWLALSPELALNDIETRRDNMRGRGYRVLRAADDKLVTGHGGTMWASRKARITQDVWLLSQEAFEANISPPLWIDFLLDAHRAAMVGDLRACVVAAAIATETVIREGFRRSYPSLPESRARKILDSVPLHQLMQRMDETMGWSDGTASAAGFAAVKAVVKLRNDLLHQGSDHPASVVDHLPGVSRFVLQADETLVASVGGRDWLAASRSQSGIIATNRRY